MWSKYIILTFFALIQTSGLFAQDNPFSASAPATVQQGQQFQYTVQGSEQGQVQLPSTKDFEVMGGPFTSFSSSTRWINGKMTAETVASYTYVMRSMSPGEFTIPAAKVKVRKDIFETNEVKVSVIGSGSSANQSTAASGTAANTSNPVTSSANTTGDQPVFLRVLPSKKTVFLGEQFVSELKVFTSVNTRPTGGLKEVPYEGFYKHALEADQNSTRENINGTMHVTQVLQRHVIIPQKSGKIVIEPFESEWTIPQRLKSKQSGSVFDQFFDDPFNDPFFDRYQDVPVKISTQPVTINVKPLPSGAPKGFTGGVGDLNFTAKLSSKNVKVNDALSLQLTISGIGNISLIGAPEIDFPPDHDVYETTKSTKINTKGNRVSGSVTFEYPIVARHAGNFRIAPVSFAWFDPATEKYRQVVTDEFNFTVEKGEGNEGGGEIFVPGLRSEEVENIGKDILDINRSIPELQAIGKTPLGNIFYWLAYIFMLVIFLIAVFILRVYFRQKADIRLTRNRKANKMARNRLKTADKARKTGDSEKFFEETEKAIWGYLADKLSIELSSLSRDKVSELLKNSGSAEDLQTELLRIIDDCEFSRYAPSSEKSDMNLLYSDAIKLINNLEHNIGKK